MSKVTVLVAAYNAQPYLRACLDSLRRQSLTDFQAICVDDASTDDTPEILDGYAAEDPRFQVVHLSENGGQAKARNIALSMAAGDYVCMLDSDDWLSDNALQEASEVLDQHPGTDCVLFQVEEVFPDHSRRYPMPRFETITGQEAFEYSLTWAVHGLYMLRNTLHQQYPYDDSSRAYSDDNTTRIHYLRSREVRQCGGIYYYRQHESSVTHQVSARRFDYLLANESMKRQILSVGVEERLLNVYEKVRWLNLIDTYMFYFNHRRQLSPEDRRHGLSEMKRVWKGMETHRIPLALRCKPGYMPLRPFWWLFRMQEECYFGLRKWCPWRRHRN